MSFQYINPYFIPKNYGYMQQGVEFAPNAVNQPINYMQNPYQTSLYNQNSIYPYNPIFTPKIGQNYVSLGQIKAPNNENVHLFQLSNGQKVAIMPRKDEATIVKTFLDGGSMNETDRVRGISHCIEHCLFKGSNKLQDGDVFRLTSLMGASTNASTDYAQTDYYITAPYMNEANLAKTIQIQGDMISNPLFDAKAIESEKGPIKSEISMINDDVTTKAFDKVIRNLFQINSLSHNMVAGSIETVGNLTKKDLVEHHDTYYTPQNLYTVVVGDVDVDKTIELISKNFTIPAKSNAGQRKEVLTPIQKPIREDIISPKTNHTNVIMAFAGPKPQDTKDFIIAEMVDFYLSQCADSKLKKDLEQISGDYASTMQKVGLNSYDPYALISVLGLNAKDEQKGLDSFYDAIQSLQTIPLNDDDMQSMQKYIQKQLEYKLSSSEDICNMLGGSLLDNSLDYFSNYRAIAQSITKEDIMNFTQKYYDLNKVSIMVVHPSFVSESDIRKNYQQSKYSFKNTELNPNIKTISFTGNRKTFTNKIEEYKLPNNAYVALNSTDSDICAFNWCVNTQPIKPKNPNIPAVLAYMFNKGTNYRNQNELEKHMQLNGIDANVFVNGKSIEITADCLSQSTAQTLALMNELMYHPKLTQSDFEDAKRYVKDTLIASQKDATSNLLDNLYPGYFPTNTSKLKAIDELKLEDVKEFYIQLLKSGSSTFVATAPFEKHPELKQSVISYQNISNISFSNSTPNLKPIFEANKEANIVIDTDDLNQAQIRKTYKFPLSGNIEDEAKFELVNTILGGTPNSRLFSDLREKQNLAYSVSSYIQSFENTGILTLAIQTTTDDKEQNVQSHDNVRKSLEGFNKHTQLLCNELVSDDELQAAKMKLKQNVIGLCQEPLSETSLLSMNAQEPYGIKRIDKYIEAIDKITKEDIQKAAQFMFSHNPTTSILASQDTINTQIEFLKTQGRIDIIQT